MSSLQDKNYIELCKKFAERSRHAKLAFDKDEDKDSDDIDDKSNEFDESIPHSLNYTFITGDRKDSELMWVTDDECLYVSNGKIIAKDSSEAYTCIINKCNARVYLKPNGVAYKVTEHTVNHGNMYETYKKCQCRAYMREECKSAGASKSIKDIYDEAVVMWNQDPLCDGPFPISFQQISRSMSNWRKEKYETSPKNVCEIRKAFENPNTLKDLGTSLHREQGLIYNFLKEEENYSYLVLSSPKSIELITQNLEVEERFLLIDGTFRITPMCNVFKQVLIIHAQFGIKSFPLVAVLMSNRTTEAYTSVYDYIHKNILPLNARGIITDFELALRNGLRSVVPATPLYGCWFHHCQALRRRVAADPKLLSLVRKDKNAGEIYRTFQCMALLPQDKIEPFFDQFAYETLQKLPEFAKFIEYYDKQWIKKETPKNYSLFLQDTRTTGAAEAFNGKCGKTFKTHGNLFNFMTVFQKEEVVKTNELERDVAGLIQRDTRRKTFRDRSVKIEYYSHQLADDKISAKRFLKMMCHMDNKIVFNEHEYPILDTNEIEFENSDDLKQYEKIIIEANDSDPILMKSSSGDHENISVASQKELTSKSQPKKPTVLTRSKARKIAQLKDSGASSSEATSGNAIKSTQNTILTRLGKRRLEENSSAQNHSRAKKSTMTTMATVAMVATIELDSDLDDVTSYTSSKDEVVRLNQIFNRIAEKKEKIVGGHDHECIMQCKRSKGTVLLPCKHQPTCRQCFVMWKLFLSEKKIDVFCPMCQEDVIEHIAICD